MAKGLWQVTMSLDGFIAGPEDDMSWLSGHLGPNPKVEEFLTQVGAAVIGHRTHRLAGTAESRLYRREWSGPQFVVTRDDPSDAAPGFTFISDLGAAMDAARQAAGDGYVAVLGATTARRCLELGLVDELLVQIVPVLLGDGVRLFEVQDGERIELEWIDRAFTVEATTLRAHVVR